MKKVLNSEAVKIIALVTMLIDHIGYIMYGHIDTGCLLYTSDAADDQ